MKNKGIVFRYIWRYKFRYLIGLVTLFLVDYFNLNIPQIIGEITDGLVAYSLDINGLIALIIKLLCVAFGISLGRVMWRVFIFGTSRMIENGIRNDLFRKLEDLSPRYFNTHKTGDLMTHFTNDLEALRNSMGPAIITSFDAVVMTIMVLYKMMVYVDWRLTLMTLVPMSMIAIGGYYLNEMFEKRFAKKQEAFAKMSDQVQESVSAERVIKAFVQERYQDESFAKVNMYNLKMNMQVVKLMAVFMPALDLIIGISYAITIIFGGYLAITNQITLGRFIAFNQYLGMLIWPMIALGDSLTMFSQGRAAIGRINQVFNEVPDIVDGDSVDYTINTLKGEITIEGLTFAYNQELKPALKDINLKIKQGETLAILGRTGDGKTTLINLLLRLYDIDQGSIKFDGHNIKEIPLHVLRSNIAYVPQDSYLFSDTLRNNIAFGKRNATLEEVIEVCKDACVHDNIVDFTDGYDTVVGERGVTLSGGQKQRSAIARALLKDAPILILDDALSAVDTDTEDKILYNLNSKRQNKTTIMIAHRISTMKNADHILVLDEGSVKEYGTFEELIALNGTFKQMYDKQQLEKQIREE